MIAAGAAPVVLEQVRSAGTPAKANDFEVWVEDFPTLEAFLDLGTCWSWVSVGMGEPVRTGLASVEIESTLRVIGVRGPDRLAMFRDLRMMERAALDAMRSDR